MSKLTFFILLFSVFIQNELVAQTNYPLFYDKDQSMQFGANNSLIVHKALYSFQDQYIPDTLWEENKFIKKSLGIGYRMTKLFFLDFQEDFLIYLVQHEVFGHGARYREFGSKNNSYKLNLFYPFGSASGQANAGSIYQTTPHKTISASIAGVQANRTLSSTLSHQILLSDQIHYRQALLYLMSQSDQLIYTWTDYYNSVSGKTGGDMNGYVNKLNNIYLNKGKTYSLKQMSLQSLVSIVNPLQMYSAFTILYTYAIKGQKHLSNIPMIKIGKIKYLPLFNYNISPFGGEYVLSNNLRHNNQLYVIDLGVSDHFYDDSYRLKIKALNVFEFKKIKFNFHMGLWNQPELELESSVGLFMPKEENIFGGSIMSDIIFNPQKDNNKFGFYCQIGYKTKGFEIGDKLDKGFLFKYGLNFSF
jgi:hypothetical protein